MSLSPSSDSGGEGIVLRLLFGDDWTGLDTGTADAVRRTPAVEVLVALTILMIALIFRSFVETRWWARWFVYRLGLVKTLHTIVNPKKSFVTSYVNKFIYIDQTIKEASYRHLNRVHIK